jgi:hypothetical protein
VFKFADSGDWICLSRVGVDKFFIRIDPKTFPLSLWEHWYLHNSSNVVVIKGWDFTTADGPAIAASLCQIG